MHIQSTPEHSPYPSTAIYAAISDLSRLDQLRSRLEEYTQGKKIEIELIDATHCRLTAPLLGQVDVMRTMADPDRKVTYRIAHDLIPADLTLELLDRGEGGCDLVCSAEAEVNPFIAPMVRSRLSDGIQHLAKLLAQINYGSAPRVD